jgi:hypothetical protein
MKNFISLKLLESNHDIFIQLSNITSIEECGDYRTVITTDGKIARVYNTAHDISEQIEKILYI